MLPRMSPREILFDFRHCEISGATPAALEAYERALAAFQSWRTGAENDVALALQEAPLFVMAHVLQAYLHLTSRDPAIARAAAPILAGALALPANARERLHLQAIAAALADDYERVKALLSELLRNEPRDVLALQIAHSFDYLTGDVVRMRDRVAGVLPAWSLAVGSAPMPGYHAVLAMHAFGLEESGDYERAEAVAKLALSLDLFDARAHHALAHVFEMTSRPAEGVQWLYQHVAYWSTDTTVATHCWWHLALFHLALGQVRQALSLYDLRVRNSASQQVGDLIDASALLWRIELQGGRRERAQVRARWNELAVAWAPHISDGFCTFNDLHAMLAFVGARKWHLAERMEHELARRQSALTRHGETTRLVGLSATRALLAFGRGDYGRAIELLASLPPLAHRIGGSHAQRDVLDLTLLRAAAYIRRPLFRLRSLLGATMRRRLGWKPGSMRYRPTAA